jgi:hypothetical protein
MLRGLPGKQALVLQVPFLSFPFEALKALMIKSVGHHIDRNIQANINPRNNREGKVDGSVVWRNLAQVSHDKDRTHLVDNKLPYCRGRHSIHTVILGIAQ